MSTPPKALLAGTRRPLSSVSVRFWPRPRKLRLPVPPRTKKLELLGVVLP
jgi:hypothetical protein